MFKFAHLSALFIAGAFMSQPAPAAETSAPVKASQWLKTTKSWDGTPITFAGGQGEVTTLSIDIQPGAETGWHLHPVPSFAMVLQGTLQVRLQDGRAREFQAGEAFAEVVNTAHNGRNAGTVPVKLLVVYAGAPGATLTEKQ
jgi:quercetin dioxygenase-like cupin family protein